MTYAVVGFLTALQVVSWFGWFIVEIIIHSLNRDSTFGSYQQMLSQQSMQIYQYQGVIMAGALAAAHLAASVKTRASRVSSFVVQIFAFLAWFWELYFIIPTFNSHGNTGNLFCATSSQFGGANTPYSAYTYTPELSVCRLAIAVASFAVIMQAWQGLFVVYSFAQIFIAPTLEDGTKKEIIEEDDAEVATVVAANPAGYEGVNARVRMWSTLSLLLTALSLFGYAIFMYSMIDVVRQTQFVLNQNVNEYGTSQMSQIGDFVLSWNFRQLSLTLVFALAASGYAAFRHNRGIQAGALFLTFVTMLQWWSLIIFSGRFLRQYQNDTANINIDNPNFNNIGYPKLSSQKAMYAGACVILAGETLRTFVLLGRYFSYVPVTRNNIIPTYIRGAFATANPIPVMLFWFEVAVTLAWWVLQFVIESNTGVFGNVAGVTAYPGYVPMMNVVTETLFIWQTMYLLAVFIPELFSERTKTLASKQAAFAVNITIICAYFLLSWPWAYAGSHKNGGYWESGTVFPVGPAGSATTGPNPPLAGFCNQSANNQGHDNCYLMQGASILSFVGGLGFVLLALWQIARILSIFPTPGQVATIDGTVVDALPPNVGIQKALGWTSSLLLIGLLIWALTAIDAGSGWNGFSAWTWFQLPSTPGWQDPQNGFFDWNSQLELILAYTYSIAFGDLVIIAFTVWAAEEMASNPVVANWYAWRTLVTGLAGLLFSFFLPQFILVCRFVNWGSMDGIGKGIASGFIIMCVGDFALYACSLSAQRSPLIALPAAINNTAAPVGVNNKGAPVNNSEVVVDTTKPGNPVVGTAGPNATYGNAYSEPTVTSTENPIPTRDYSGNQQVPV